MRRKASSLSLTHTLILSYTFSLTLSHSPYLSLSLSHSSPANKSVLAIFPLKNLEQLSLSRAFPPESQHRKLFKVKK